MDFITLTLRKNHLLTALSIAGLAGVTYLTNKYVKNTEQTTNQTYFKNNENIYANHIQSQFINSDFNTINNNNNNNTININTINNNNIIYIFWNGDIASTYLLIDLLLQDKVIQPLYIERYTIIKELEKDKLEYLARDNKQEKTQDTTILKNKQGEYKNKNNTKFLKNISDYKKKQEYESKQLEILRLMILAQYPEFRKNLLPTTYITTISKDLEYTSKFYNTLKEISPIHSEGIDFVEQVVRFLKHYDKIKTRNGSSIGKIIIAFNKDYKNKELLLKLINKNIINKNQELDIDVDIHMPVIDMDNKTIRFMAVEFFPNDIMYYFMKNEKS